MKTFLYLSLSFFMFAANAAEPVDTTQLQCLAANIFAKAENPEDRVRIGLISHNRVASGEFGGNYCEEAAEDTRGPWERDAAILVRNLAAAERGSSQFKKAQAELKAYRTALTAYQQSQVVAYRILKGQVEDVTGGATEYETPEEEDS